MDQSSQNVVWKRVSNIKLASILGTVLLLLGAPAIPAAAADAPAAVLTATEGEVTIQRGEESLAGTFGAPLASGDIVKTGAKGKATVLYPSGKIVQLGPSTSLDLKAGAGDDTGDLLLQVPDVSGDDAPIFAQAASTEQGLAAVPAMRSGDAEIEAIGPRNTKVRAGALTFRWSEVDDALEYTLILSGPGAGAGKHRVTETSWTAPADGFAPGETWTWSVEAMTPSGPVASNPVSFEVASEATAAELARLEGSLAPLIKDSDALRSDTAAYLLATYCRSLEFYADAIVHLEGLAARHAERKELHRQLGSLYEAVGQDRRAAESYRRALGD